MPNFLEITKEEYVVERFKAIPKELIRYLRLDEDDDAKAIVEIAFRSEYFRNRHDALEVLLCKAYRKYMAARKALERLTTDVDMEIAMVLEDPEYGTGKITDIPTEF